MSETTIRAACLVLVLGAVACNDDGSTTDDSGETGDTGTVVAIGEVDPTLFIGVTVAEVDCELSDGTATTCISITSDSVPTDHTTGPFCPTQVTDGEDAGGIWFDDGIAYDVTGSFVEGLATFYGDATWDLVNDDGSINYTETSEECEAAARPDVDPDLYNHCVQCLPEYLDANPTYTYLIPKTPVPAGTTQAINGNMGVAFNGVEFAAPAPVDAILGAYTIAPFDDCGGHINLAAGYHYHGVTTVDCLTREVQDDGHAGMIGYALDGFPMHDMLNGDGEEPADLDVCRGHTDDTRGYHYHVSGAGENQIIGCFAGLTVGTTGGGPPGPPPN